MAYAPYVRKVEVGDEFIENRRKADMDLGARGAARAGQFLNRNAVKSALDSQMDVRKAKKRLAEIDEQLRTLNAQFDSPTPTRQGLPGFKGRPLIQDWLVPEGDYSIPVFDDEVPV